jgi:tRNA uridine 5-carbamoylmethylation protein Kti12
LSMMRSQQEETEAKLKEVNMKKEETESRLKQIELQVQDVLFEACGGWPARKDSQISNVNLDRNSSSLPQLQHLMKQNINTPSKAATAFKNSLD